MSASHAFSLVSEPLQAFELRLREVVRSKVEFIELIADNLVAAGGKRFRPSLVYLAFRALGATHPQETELAVAVELLHSATLLHDDLIDDADTRRGREAAFRRYGNAVSVLSGDFLLSRVLQILSGLPSALTASFAQTAMDICEGEVLQFQVAAYQDYSLENYLEIITAKTAVLLELACVAPAMLLAVDAEKQNALATFGREYGRAFQIQDDILDLTADPLVLGKPIGGDLREGKVTLPVLHLLEDAEYGAEVFDIVSRRASEEGDVERVVALARQTGALERSVQQLRRHAQLAQDALLVLPISEARAALAALAQEAANRDF